ncbi:MAG: hypothetical protein V2I27_09630 [Erythrobacter sp.]|jgi:hypothetical protein|nr:hypothetical protein [Erythrobacter sp.]
MKYWAIWLWLGIGLLGGLIASFWFDPDWVVVGAGLATGASIGGALTKDPRSD